MLKFCEDCDNVTAESRKSDPRYWCCIKFPRDVPPGFVVRGTWTNGEPYQFCRKINTDGECSKFKPKRTTEQTEGI